MPQIQSHYSLASQHATALSTAVSGSMGSVSRDEQTTLVGNQSAGQAIAELEQLQQQLEGLVMEMMGNVQGLASEFQATDQALSQTTYWV